MKTDNSDFEDTFLDLVTVSSNSDEEYEEDNSAVESHVDDDENDESGTSESPARISGTEPGFSIAVV